MTANRCRNPKCEYFNKTLPNNAKVCPWCSTPLGNVVTPTPTSNNPIPSQPTPQQPIPQQPIPSPQQIQPARPITPQLTYHWQFILPYWLPDYHYSNSFTLQVGNFNGLGKKVLLVVAVKI